MKNENIMLRLSEQDKRRWTEAAQKRGMTLSEFIRYVVNVSLEPRQDDGAPTEN